MSQSLALEEAVAQASEMALSESRFAENMARQNPTLAQSIRSYLKKLKARVANIFKGAKYISAASYAMRNTLSDYVRVWDSALAKALGAQAGQTQADSAQSAFESRDGKTQVYTSDNQRVDAHWALIDAKSRIASNDPGSLAQNPEYPAALQPRDRSRQASEDQISDIARSLNPARLMESSEVSTGAPIIGPDRIVESGNGRTIAIQRVLASGGELAKRYTQALKDRAASLGLNPDDVTDTSVLVRVRDTGMTDSQRAAFAQASNVAAISGYAASESASSDAGKISDRTLDSFNPGGGFQGNVGFYLDFLNDAVPASERNAMLTRNGQPTQALVARAENALFQRAYGSAELTAHMAERADPEAKNAVTALQNVAARVAQIKDRISAGTLHDIDFSSDLAQAAEEFVQLKRGGESVADWLSQTSIFGESSAVKGIVELMEKYKRSASKLTGALNDMLSQVEAAGNPNQASLLDNAVPTKMEIIDSAKQAEGTRYSLRTLPDGSKYTLVEADEIIYDGVKEEYTMSRKAREYMKKRFKGVVLPLGSTKKAFVGKTGINEYGNPAARLKWETYRSKMLAATELQNLLKAGTFVRWNKDDGRHEFATRGWNTWRTRFVVEDSSGQNRAYSGEIKIQLNSKGDEFYDITQIKDITSDTIGQQMIADATSRAESAGYDDSVAQPDASVNPQNDGKRFSLRSGVEQVGNLVAVHNLTQDQLLSDIGLGGFPMPSIAIVKASQGHSQYGDVSVVFNSSTIDPEANRANQVYGADAWTPTFPDVAYEIDQKAADRLYKKLYDLHDHVDARFKGDITSFVQNTSGVSTNYSLDEIIEKAKRNTGLQAAYLEDKGKHVDIVETTSEAPRGFMESDVDIYQAILDRYGDQLRDLFRRNATGKEILGAVGDGFLQLIPGGESMNRFQKWRWLKEAIAYDDYQKNGPAMQTVVDMEQTQKNMDAAINVQDYEVWLRNLYEGVIGQKGIRNSVDTFTPSGNRRSFKQTYNPYTLNNLVKTMAQSGDRNATSFGPPRLVPSASKSYSSLQDIRNDQGRLGRIDEAQYKEMENKLEDSLQAVVSQIIGKKGEVSYYDRSISQEELYGIIAEEAGKNSYASRIQQQISRAGYQITSEQAAEIRSLIEQAREIPTGYFEAKPRRAVGLDEIAAVIIPKDSTASLKSALQQNNVKTLEYASGNEEDRLEKLNSLVGARFSLRSEPEMTDREVLGEAMREVAANPVESLYLDRYQQAYHDLVSNQRAQRQQARIMRNIGDEKDADYIKARNRAALYQTRAHRAEAALNKLESDSRFADLARRERERAEAAVARDYESGAPIEQDRANRIRGYERRLRDQRQALSNYRQARRDSADRSRCTIARALPRKTPVLFMD